MSGVTQKFDWTGKPMSDFTTTAYIPTVFTAPPELRFGETWYVKFPNDTALSKVVIDDVTEKTVYLSEYTNSGSYAYNSRRYKKTDIEFVEKVKEND